MTSGADYIIQDISLTPEFDINDNGFYHIHSFVFDPLDFPNGFVSVTVGVSPISHGTDYLEENDLCGDLNEQGTEFFVVDCQLAQLCDAEAGSVILETDNLCIENGSATINFEPLGDAVIPDSFVQIYVLTVGDDNVIVTADTCLLYTSPSPRD